MRSLNLYLYLYSMLILVSIFLLFLDIKNIPDETLTIQSSYIASIDKGGFDLNSTALSFGAIPLGSKTTRSVTFYNNNKYPVEVKFFASPEINKNIYFNRSLLLVKPLSSVNISFTLQVPVNETIGKHYGLIRALVFNRK